ncbi:amino acid ABC transporter permease [Periweissella beninensis]|uniref:Amino acid ABC transporter permease n=1 Tax=Periweissella beninensis TaxID=504936 RepID=A0ABT0VJ72_9LACO|nr:amino acid ABC transporter permease [Periweissella beninensis]MBM7544435.1 putative glutamine transport system permease protein [Periweissella beninensis]MCM2437878.1 amino acid ABC transporter permease [Periweissella beninensis]MCT4396736.1 amino acid ABC transporter permease [Periweissella beninensis]
MKNFVDAYSWINITYLFKGLLITLEVSIISLLLSFIIGSFLGVIRYSRIKWVSGTVGFIIDIIRNLPLLLIIFFTYFALPKLQIHLSIMQAAISALTVFESAMIAEIVRSGINSVPIGQTEGARANGLTSIQTMWHIILPQAYKKMIPPLVSQFISLIKDTSLATIIVLPDLMYHAQIIYGQNNNYIIPMFLAISIMYFVVNYALSLIARWLDRRLV